MKCSPFDRHHKRQDALAEKDSGFIFFFFLAAKELNNNACENDLKMEPLELKCLRTISLIPSNKTMIIGKNSHVIIVPLEESAETLCIQKRISLKV